MKHLFPDDPAIDFVYRNTVGEGYEAFKEPVRFGHPFHVSDALVQAIFAEEYAPRTWDQAPRRRHRRQAADVLQRRHRQPHHPQHLGQGRRRSCTS